MKQEKKDKILEKYFPDNCSGLRQIKADEYVEQKKAKNFKEACILIKQEEEKLKNQPAKKSSSISEVEKGLIDALYGNDK